MYWKNIRKYLHYSSGVVISMYSLAYFIKKAQHQDKQNLSSSHHPLHK